MRSHSQNKKSCIIIDGKIVLTGTRSSLLVYPQHWQSILTPCSLPPLVSYLQDLKTGVDPEFGRNDDEVHTFEDAPSLIRGAKRM